MAMAGLGGGDPAEIWRWPLTYYLLVRKEFLRASNIKTADSPARPGERVIRREVRAGIEIEHFERD